MRGYGYTSLYSVYLWGAKIDYYLANREGLEEEWWRLRLVTIGEGVAELSKGVRGMLSLV